MLLKDHAGKKIAATILEKVDGDHSADSMKAQNDPQNKKPEDTNVYDMGYKSAAEDLMFAIKRNDPDRAVSAIKSFLEMSMNERQKKFRSKL